MNYAMKINDEVKKLFALPLVDGQLTDRHKELIHSIASKCRETRYYKQNKDIDEQVNIINELSDMQIYNYILDKLKFSKSELELYAIIRLMIPVLSYKLMSMDW